MKIYFYILMVLKNILCQIITLQGSRGPQIAKNSEIIKNSVNWLKIYSLISQASLLDISSPIKMMQCHIFQ